MMNPREFSMLLQTHTRVYASVGAICHITYARTREISLKQEKKERSLCSSW